MGPHAWPLTINLLHSTSKSNTTLSCSADLPSRPVTWAAPQPSAGTRGTGRRKHGWARGGPGQSRPRGTQASGTNADDRFRLRPAENGSPSGHVSRPGVGSRLPLKSCGHATQCSDIWGTVTKGSRHAGGGGEERNQVAGRRGEGFALGARGTGSGTAGDRAPAAPSSAARSSGRRGDPVWLPPPTPTARLPRQRVDRRGHHVSQSGKATLMVVMCDFRLFLSWERKTSTEKL